MITPRAKAIQYATENRASFLKELIQFASIPSISTDPGYRADIERAAEWVAGQLRTLGMDNVEVLATAGHPVVFGEFLSAGAGSPTVLVYGHYDVQPAEPLELWESGAFTPTKRGESLYGRGVSDMKGQVMAALKAIEAIKHAGKVPVNLKFLFEGEEEIGSPSLGEFIARHKKLLACDFALNPDTGMISSDVPTITYALRGLAYFELHIYGPDHDLHSGTFGGVVHNPAQVLCELIAGMHDHQGRVTLPGFYTKVRPLDAGERAELARLPMGEDFYLAQIGAPALWGETGYSPVERTGARPTLEVNGIISGYTGPGGKTVLPAHAMAKISTRLVPDQEPEDVHQAFLRYLETEAPPTIKWQLNPLHSGRASISDRSSLGIQALSKAQETVWGTRPVFKREGGSVPVVAQFQELLGIQSVNTGFSLYDDKAHSPNEKLHLPTWYRGIDTFIHFFYNLEEAV
jgi:acetylornithine deacetylase/succinyl-diaminopimelate desuccinylase-like protein